MLVSICHLFEDYLNILICYLNCSVCLWSIRWGQVMGYSVRFQQWDNLSLEVTAVVWNKITKDPISTDYIFLFEAYYIICFQSAIWHLLYPLGKVIDSHDDVSMYIKGFRNISLMMSIPQIENDQGVVILYSWDGGVCNNFAWILHLWHFLTYS